MAGRRAPVVHNPEVELPTDLSFFNEAELGHPKLDEDKWGALENRVFDLSGGALEATSGCGQGI